MPHHDPNNTESSCGSDVDARVRGHMPLVFRTARHHWEMLGRRVDYAELVTAGALAVLKAAERHDERRAPFSHHARRRLMWAMKDVARRRLGRHLDPSQGAPSCAAQRFGDGGRRLAAVGADDARLGSFLEGGNAWRGTVEAMSLPADVAMSARMSPEEEVARQQLLVRLRAAIDTLDGPARHLVERHYFDGERFCAIASELGMSTFAVCRLHRRALTELRRSLGPNASADLSPV